MLFFYANMLLLTNLYIWNQITLSMKIRIAKYVLGILFFLILGLVKGQQSSASLVSPTGDTIIITSISVLDLSSKILDFDSNQKTFINNLKTRDEILEIDTSSLKAADYLKSKREQLEEDIDNFTLVQIENANREWLNYKNTLEKWEGLISNRITELENTIFRIQVEKKTWELTKETNKKQSIPKESLNRINDVLLQVKKLESATKSKQDSILIIQNKITDFQILVNESLNLLEGQRKELQSNYFIQDSPALWNANDSTFHFRKIKEQLKSSLDEHKKSINLFTSSNINLLIWHLIIFFTFLGLFYYLNIVIKKQDLPKDENTNNLKYFISRYFLSSLLISISFTLILYSNIPASVRETMAFLLLIPSILLYHQKFPKNVRVYLYILILLYAFDKIHLFFSNKAFITRMLVLLQNGIYIYIMYIIVKKNSPIRSLFKRNWSRGIISISNFLIVVSFISMLANVLGFVNLSSLLSNTLVAAIVAPFVLNLLVQILDAFFTGLFSTNLLQNSNIVRHHGVVMLKKLHSIFLYLAIFLWLRSIAVNLGIAYEIGEWLFGLLNNKWEVGSVTISFGGIIAFFVVIIITSILTRVIKIVLEDEIFPRVSFGRGVPGAISMVIRYTIVAFGIYVALSAAGVDLGQFGLIAGALGVGIGFGLQGIVYNFIAGLILAFERPVQKGDTIQVGTIFGDVKEIGVRASKVQTYDGSTIIIPNGNLISNELTNWTFSKRVRRREIKVGVAYGNNPHEVMDLLFKVADKNEKVLPFPKPWPIFEGFGDSSLNFAIRFWVNFDQGVTIQSEVAMEIYDALEEAGITIPFPQTDLHVKSFDPTIQKTVFPFSKDQKKKAPGRKSGRTEKQDDTP